MHCLRKNKEFTATAAWGRLKGLGSIFYHPSFWLWKEKSGSELGLIFVGYVNGIVQLFWLTNLTCEGEGRT